MWNQNSAGSPDQRRPYEEEKVAGQNAKSNFDYGDFHSKLNSISKAIDNNENMMNNLGVVDDMHIQQNYGKKRKGKKKKRRRIGSSEGQDHYNVSGRDQMADQSSLMEQQVNERSGQRLGTDTDTNVHIRPVRGSLGGQAQIVKQMSLRQSNRDDIADAERNHNLKQGFSSVQIIEQNRGQNNNSAVNQMSRDSPDSSSGESETSQESSSQAENSQHATQPDEELLDYDQVELMSENDSQGSQYKPTVWVQNLYDIWKFLGVINYQVTLTLLIAYFINSNFASEYLLDIFKMFLLVRPGMIVLYSIFVTCMDTHKTYVRRNKFVRQKRLDELNFEYASEIGKSTGLKRQTTKGQPIHHNTAGSQDEGGLSEKMQVKAQAQKQNNAEGELEDIMPTDNQLQVPENLAHIMQDSDDEDEAAVGTNLTKNYLKEIEFEHPELSDYQELFWQFFFMPVVIYAGLGRLVVVSDRKTTVGHFSMAQELFLHTLPLGYLVNYNNDLVQKPRDIDDYVRYAILANLGQMMVEIMILKFARGANQNLERRPALKSSTRCDDLLRVFIVACIFTSASVLLGLYAFSNQGCIEGNFVENGFCKSCIDEVDINCDKCDDRFECKECKRGYFGLDRQCIPCQNRFGKECQQCTAGGCTVCSEGYFVSYGQCQECRFLSNCLEQNCEAGGCTRCENGYYLDEGVCKACASAIAGCKQCESADQCTTCVSDYLYVDKGICKCREEGRNQYTDKLTGACFCEAGYHMTENGCLDCPYLIPGCEQCSLTTRNTGIPLYALASYFENPQQQYLDCDVCVHGRFVERGNSSGLKSKCTHCSARWEGCSYCGDRGGSCDECYQTHLLEGTFDKPCVRCEEFMYDCVKCLNVKTCTLQKPSRNLFSSDTSSLTDYNEGQSWLELP